MQWNYCSYKNTFVFLTFRKRKYVVTTQSFSRFFKYKDHYNGVVWTGPHQAWVSDITYVRIAEGFMYLFLVTDAYSRKIIGWKLAPSMETRWAVDSLKQAMRQCPEHAKTVHHSDRGFQYCSHEYTRLLHDRGMQPSMGQVGYCYDNAMAERVNGI